MFESTLRPLNIIIAGGGIAGLAAAGYLRAQHNVTVLERDDLNFEKNVRSDYGLSVVANAYKLLLAQGINVENLDGVLLTHIWRRTENNDIIDDIVFDTRPMFGAPSILTLRSRLQAELYRFATDPSRPGEPAQIITNIKIKSVDPIAGIVVTDEGDSYRGDLVIGADGINSLVRTAVLAQASSSAGKESIMRVPENDIVVPSGRVAYVSVVPVNIISSDQVLSFQTAPDVSGICAWTSTKDNRTHIICYPRNHEYCQIVAYAPEGSWADEFAKGRSSIIRDVPAERVLRDFEEFHPSIKNILSCSPTIDVYRIRDIDPLDNWAAGKTILIGDAAHAATPHLGQGCNIAIEDAEGLGYLFRDISIPISSSTDAPAPEITEQLSIFQSLRVKRAHIVQSASRQRGGMLKDEVKEKRDYDRAVFSKLIYTYNGFEAAYKAHLAENESS